MVDNVLAMLSLMCIISSRVVGAMRRKMAFKAEVEPNPIKIHALESSETLGLRMLPFVGVPALPDAISLGGGLCTTICFWCCSKVFLAKRIVRDGSTRWCLEKVQE